MKIMITGGSGFIGSNLLSFFSENYPNYEIISFGRKAPPKGDYNFVEGDILHIKDLRKALHGVDYVFHLAAESHVDVNERSKFDFIKSNVLGTQILLEASLANNIKKIIYLSSSEVYGDKSDGLFKETDPINPKNLYGASKAASEIFAEYYYKFHDLPIVIVRACNIFGENQKPDKIISKFINNLLQNKKIPIYGEGKSLRSYLYVKDLCNALVLLLEKGEPGEIYNIGSKDELSALDLARMILNKLGKNETYIEFAEARDLDRERAVLDISKIEKLGWRQKTNFEEALDKTISWYKRKNPND